MFVGTPHIHFSEQVIPKHFHFRYIVKSMDAYDLFRKLGSGAKFDFKRFRSDAERLQLVKSAVPPKLQTQSSTENKSNPGNSSQKSNPSLQKTSSNKTEDTDSSSDDSSSDGSDSDSGSSSSEPVPQQDSIKPDLNQASSDTDESDDNDLSSDTSGSESDAELQLLGNIKAKGDEGGNTRSEERKKRKRKKKVTSAQKTADLKQEQINHVRNLHHVHVYGTDVPDPVESFDKLQAEYSIHPRIIENIEAVGYKCPTPIQIQAIPVMLHNREIMACAPTGSGKTAAFILPIMHHLKEPRNAGIRALILAPTRELAKQTCREFQRLSEGIGFKILYVDKIGQDTRRLKRAFKKMDVLVSTPNRLVFMLNQSPPLISLSCVQWLVVDESDKLFEEGKAGFRDQLGTIYKACDGNNLRRAMFSATFAYDVEEWCKLNLDNVVQVYIGARNAATHTIEQSLLFCGSETGKLLAIRDIIRKGIQPPVLVFVQSKERAKELFHELIYDGMNVDVIHADRTQLQRDNVIKSFRAGKIWILICTELMGRGIDFKGVNLVLNYDFPNSAITYIHRIGRTGRAGRTGKAITFFTEDDCVNLRSIANVMKTAGCPVPDYMLKINKPDKRDRKKLARSSLKRKHISTVTKYDLQKAKKKRRMVEEGKKKKIREQGGDPDTVVQNAAQKNKKRSTENGNADGERKRKTTGNFVKSNKFQKHNKFVKGGPKNKLRQFSQKGKKNFKQNTES